MRQTEQIPEQMPKDKILEVSFAVPTFNQRFTWIVLLLFAAGYLGFLIRIVWPALQRYPMSQFSIFILLILPVAVLASQCWIGYRMDRISHHSYPVLKAQQWIERHLSESSEEPISLLGSCWDDQAFQQYFFVRQGTLYAVQLYFRLEQNQMTNHRWVMTVHPATPIGTIEEHLTLKDSTMGTLGIQRFVESWLGIFQPSVIRKVQNKTESCCLLDYVQENIYWSAFGYYQHGAWEILLSKDPNVGKQFQILTHLEMDVETAMPMIA